LSYLNAIKVSRKELEDSMTAKKSQVYEEIAAKYPEDLEVFIHTNCQIKLYMYSRRSL